MASSNPMEAHLVACVKESLSLYLYSNAEFLAERLCAQFPSKVSLVHLLRTPPCTLL